MTAPNVVILHADQQRYDSLGCTGNTFVRTPNLDRLAAKGTLFTCYIAASTLGMPARASLLTGLYPPGHNVWANGVPLNRRAYTLTNPHGVTEPLCFEPPTLADMFASAGYDTVAFGELRLTPNLAPVSYGYPETLACWEDGSFDDWHGPYYGFRHVEMTLGHGERACGRGHYATWLRHKHADVYRAVVERAALRPVPLLRDLHTSSVPAALHQTAWLAQRFCKYVQSRPTGDAAPFFAFVGLPGSRYPLTPSFDVMRDFEDVAVKEPLDPEGKAVHGMPLAHAGLDVSGLSPEERRVVLRYAYATLYQTDMAVGRILEGLKQAGVWDNTILIYSSDHGDFLCDHGLLGSGCASSNLLLHVPFILRVPPALLGDDRLPSCVGSPMSQCDVMPTLASLTGVTPPVWGQGADIVDIVRQKSQHVALAFNANGQPETTNYTLCDVDHRFSLYPQTGYTELYDHQDDPNEEQNLAPQDEFQMHIMAMSSAVQARLVQYYCPILARVAAW